MISSLWALLASYKYVVLLGGVFFEGPVIMIAAGFLIRLGYFELWPAYILLIFGDFLADMVWYAVGYFGAYPLIRKYGRFVSLTEAIVDKIIALFRKHETRILLLSKLTTGLGLAVGVLVAAGVAHVPFKKFALINFFGGFLWTAFMLTLGYFFGGAYLFLAEGLRQIFLIFVILCILLTLFGFSRFMRQKFLKNQL